MAEVCGKQGSVTLTSASTTIKTWSLSYAGDTLETTSFDDSTGGRSYIPGITSWSGSFDASYSTGNTAVPGSTGTVYLKSSTGTAVVWNGSIIITGMDITTPVDGLVTQSYTFQGNGALATST